MLIQLHGFFEKQYGILVRIKGILEYKVDNFLSKPAGFLLDNSIEISGRMIDILCLEYIRSKVGKLLRIDFRELCNLHSFNICLILLSILRNHLLKKYVCYLFWLIKRRSLFIRFNCHNYSLGNSDQDCWSKLYIFSIKYLFYS